MSDAQVPPPVEDAAMANEPVDDTGDQGEIIEGEYLEEGDAYEEYVPENGDAGTGAEEEGAALEAEIVAEEEASGGDSINSDTFEELKMGEADVEAAQNAWRAFIGAAGTREAAADALYTAVFTAVPSIQGLFTTPKAVFASRFLAVLNNLVMSLEDPPSLKVLVETVGFSHMAYEATVPRVTIFRDAIIDTFEEELRDKFTRQGRSALNKLLTYVAGAIVYVKKNFAERLQLLDESWKIATDGKANKDKFATLGSKEEGPAKKAATDSEAKAKHEPGAAKEAESKKPGAQVQTVPTTYNEMFLFNAAVMGYGQSLWMNEVLACFDNIVRNVSNSNRLSEECDVLLLRISKVSNTVNLGEYKSCMLASLRSLLPKEWSMAHEVAWCWLWEAVERMLMQCMGKPHVWEKALAKFLGSLDETAAYEFRAAVYVKFFSLCPQGQDFFKQSNTYLHLVAAKVMAMTLDMFKDPVRMTDDISAVGLRHVGYGIPTEFFAPFADAWLQVLAAACEDETAIEAYRWSIGLIAKSTVRTIMEGSTIVMKAINVNSRRQVAKAVGCAPRGERSSWVLMVKVGTQNISPLAWALEAGSIEAASAILEDLMTMRADRDRYYFGGDDMFVRHSDIVKKIIDNAPGILGQLFDGLIWRSRLTSNGMRRVNYYIKHLLVDGEGNFHQTSEWIVKFKDARIVCHPLLITLSDIVWRVARARFLYQKAWFIFTLMIFIVSQSILQHLHEGEYDEDGYKVTTEPERIMVFGFRLFIYICSYGNMLVSHIKLWVRQFRAGETTVLFGRVRIPNYLKGREQMVGLLLVLSLSLMLATEPILHCLNDSHGQLFTEECKASKELKRVYSVFCMFVMFIYCSLLLDMAVFSNAVTAYVLVCARMLSELGLFCFLGLSSLLTFSSSLSCLHQPIVMFHGIPSGMVNLFEMFTKMFSAHEFEHLHEEMIVLLAIFVFLICIVLFLGNMLIAQLSCAYSTIYNDVVGFARLQRLGISTRSMQKVPAKRWKDYVASLRLDQNIEFNEGDIGIAGGIATTEPASLHPTTADNIKRFGGTTAPSMPWPEEEGSADSDSDKLARLEKTLQSALTRLTEKSDKKGGRGRAAAQSNTGSASASAVSGTSEDQEQ